MQPCSRPLRPLLERLVDPRQRRETDLNVGGLPPPGLAPRGMSGRIALLLGDHESLGRARGIRRLSEGDGYGPPPKRHGTIVAGNLVGDPFPGPTGQDLSRRRCSQSMASVFG
jgi:hypothetical protein